MTEPKEPGPRGFEKVWPVDRASAEGLRRAAVREAPWLSDLRDAFCVAMEHTHLADDELYCASGRRHAYRIREALIRRYEERARLSTPRTETSEPVCAHPGCGLPEHLHGAPPGEPPNPTRSSHRFTPRTETSETADTVRIGSKTYLAGSDDD